MNNTLILVGRVSVQPSMKIFPDGNKLCKFAIAVKEFGADAKESSAMFVNVDARNGLGERVMEYIDVGREVALSGRLAINVESKKVGDKIKNLYYPYLKLKEIHFCGSKPKEEKSVKESKTKTRKKAS